MCQSCGFHEPQGNRREGLAARGVAAPVGAFVLLRREQTPRPALTAVNESEMLRHVVPRNFAQAVVAVDTVECLRALVVSRL